LKLLLVLIFISLSANAEESNTIKDSKPWSVDVQYDYVTLDYPNSKHTKKETTLNLLLDKRINRNINVHGDFYKKTIKGNYPVDINSTSSAKKGIREFYIESLAIPNTIIKAGKRAFKIDDKKGVQDLGVPSIEELDKAIQTCITSSFNTCSGVESIHLKSKLSDVIQIELLKIDDTGTYPLTTYKSNKVRLKYSKDALDYYVTADKNTLNGANASSSANELNNDSVEFSLEERVVVENPNQWYAKIKYVKGNNDYLRPQYECDMFRMIPPIGALSHSNRLTLGKVFVVDRLLINSSLRREMITNNGPCLDSPKAKTTINSVNLMLEYPLEHGKITARYQVNKTSSLHSLQDFIMGISDLSIKRVNSSSSSIEITHKLDKNWSSRLGYHLSKIDISDITPEMNSSVSMYSLRYKF